MAAYYVFASTFQLVIGYLILAASIFALVQYARASFTKTR